MVRAGEEPGVTHTVPIGLSSAPSRVFSDTARFVRLMADEPCHLAFGDDPTADTSCMPLAANEPELFGVAAGMRVAVIAAAP